MDEAAYQPRKDNKFLPGEVAWVGLLDSASPGVDYWLAIQVGESTIYLKI